MHQNGYLFASGGPSGTDTIPAWLSVGEYVFSKMAVDRIGLNNLDMIDRAARGYDAGGVVG